jgi:hypothetical protein
LYTDAEGCFNIFFSLLLKCSSAELPSVVDYVAQRVSAKTDKDLLRLKMYAAIVFCCGRDPADGVFVCSLASLFNAVEGAPAARHHAFLHVVRYAGVVKRFDLIAPVFDRVDTWIGEWKLSRDQVWTALITVSLLRLTVLSLFLVARRGVHRTG